MYFRPHPVASNRARCFVLSMSLLRKGIPLAPSLDDGTEFPGCSISYFLKNNFRHWKSDLATCITVTAFTIFNDLLRVTVLSPSPHSLILRSSAGSDTRYCHPCLLCNPGLLPHIVNGFYDVESHQVGKSLVDVFGTVSRVEKYELDTITSVEHVLSFNNFIRL
jgi:hypothetical protein